MEFSGASSLPCGCADIIQNSDDTFSFEVDPTKISQDDEGVHKITVSLKDSSSDTTRLVSRSSFTVEIQITPREEELDQNPTEANSKAKGEVEKEDLSSNSTQSESSS